MPDGYLQHLEASLSEKMERTQGRRGSVLKPAFALACAFAIVFAMGYGVLSLTGTLKGSSDAGEDEIIEYLASEMNQYDIMDYYAELE